MSAASIKLLIGVLAPDISLILLYCSEQESFRSENVWVRGDKSAVDKGEFKEDDFLRPVK